MTATHRARTRRVVTMTEDTYLELVDSYGGVCLACGELAWGDTEPDARGYTCSECGIAAVMGIELALMAGRVTLRDPTPEELADAGEPEPDLGGAA